ncbi:MAG: prepilin-type N-terminal cleavage/methylation domain-containing protein [Patescibacteria group bacterium]
MNITSTRNKKGFSLIELMIVIAIIAILTGIITANFTQSKSRARDAKRVSDMAQLQLSLALFFDRCNGYPVVNGITVNQLTTDLEHVSCPDGINFGTYISVIPHPPVGGDATFYKYVSNGTDYILSVDLEDNSSALEDDIDGTATMGAAEVQCDDVAFNYCVKPN